MSLTQKKQILLYPSIDEIDTDESKRTKRIMKEIIIPTGLGAGEETKGEASRFFAREVNADIIWRTGGCQSGHHIRSEDGQEQTFSHYGSGTFEGRKTYLKHMVIDPVNLFKEAIELEEKGVKNSFELINIDKDCIVITPFHGAISRLREMCRDEKKGTVGMGVGEAIKDSYNPDLTIRAGDFLTDKTDLVKKIENIRQDKLKQAKGLLINKSNYSKEIEDELEILNNNNLVELTADSFKYTANLFKIVGDEFLEELITREQKIVTETSHGALFHPENGFLPHTTQCDPTAQDLVNTLEEKGYEGKISRIGVSRCYTTRHGAGPMVSYSEKLCNSIQETHNNSKEIWNEWLGKFRNGNFDVVATKYAIEISGGKENFTGLIISYMDELAKFDEWQICTGYKYKGKEKDLENYFEVKNGIIKKIKFDKNTSEGIHYQHQIELTKILKECSPIIETLTKTENKSLEELFIEYIEKELEVPVVALGYGAGINDRKIRNGYESLFR